MSERLSGPARVTVVSASPGSGKTVLLRSWVSQPVLTESAAWVTAGRDERDPRRFWLSVVGALRLTAPAAALVRAVTAAPDLDGWAITEQLLTDLAQLRDQLWLVIDDVHELGHETLRQLELLLMRAPPRLRFVLATRHDVRLGLHRLRLEGELAEIREPDLRFSLAEARELFADAGVDLPEPALVMLYERTEGWAAGLRLAALSLAGHPDPEQFAAEFSGAERTVAEYLLAEVLDRQPDVVRRLLLRTSILEQVNGELADLLTGDQGGERALQDLERANAFVVSLDAGRTWFRYHQMFADLLLLELRRTAPGEIAGLHRAAAGWFTEHGFAEEAIRHAQAAGDWERAARLLADHWPGLYLDGQAAVIHELLAGFPTGAGAANAELAALIAGGELARGSLRAAGHYLGLAERGMASVPEARRGQAGLLLAVVRLLMARQRADVATVVAQARRLGAMPESPDAARPGRSADLRALALISLGSAEVWAARFEEADRDLDRGVVLARRVGRPFLEFTGLAYQAAAGVNRSYALAAERGRQAFELAQLHGWTEDPAFGIACNVLGAALTIQGRLEEAEPWVQRAERTVRAESDPAAGLGIYCVRGLLELLRARDVDALAAFRAATRLAGHLAAPHYLALRAWAFEVQTLVRLGEIERAGQEVAGLGDQERERGEGRIAVAVLRLARGDPQAAAAAIAPVLDGSAPVVGAPRLVQAFVLEAIAQDALGDPGAAGNALERALDLAEPDGAVAPFVLHPAPGLLERHPRHRTAHAALIAEIRSLPGGRAGAPPAGPPAGPRPPLEPLSDREIRVLRYLATNLTAPEIAAELDISRHTVKTHMRNLYAKLDTHRRAEAVTRARELGLLAPSAPGRR